MKLFLDTAITDEIKHALELWNIDGVTTNPRHIMTSGKPFRKVIEEIAELFEGTDKPISVEVNPHLSDWKEIVAEGKKLAALCPNFVIKVGISEQGCRAIRELTSNGIRVNATLIHSVAQAWHAARAGATYVSPFIGWKDQFGDAADGLIPEVRAMLDNYGFDSEIIASALRNSNHVGMAALAGADCSTAAFQVYADSFKNPYTSFGENVFQTSWDKTPTE